VVAVILFLVVLGSVQWGNSKKNKGQRRRSKDEYVYAEDAPIRAATGEQAGDDDSLYHTGYHYFPAGREMEDVDITAADNPDETDDIHDPYHDQSEDESDDDKQSDDDDDDDDDNETNDDIPARVGAQRVSGLYADKIKPDDPTAPGVTPDHVAFAKKHGRDPDSVDPYKHQSVAITGMDYLDPAKMNYVGPGNKWGLDPHRKNVSVFDVPEEYGGSGQRAEDILPTKKKKRTPKEQLNQHHSVIHREMEKNKDKMLEKLRSTVSDIPEEERTKQQQHVHNLQWDEIKNKALGTPSIEYRAHMMENIEGHNGLTKYFHDMSPHDQRRKVDHLVRSIGYTALEYNKTNLVDLLHAMRMNGDNPLHYHAVKTTLENLKQTHNVNERGEWEPKQGYTEDDMETALGRILPYGRKRDSE
jgi:hypothetical protein